MQVFHSKTMEHDNKIKKQSLTITLGSIVSAAINGIIGYVAVFFFKPLWEKLVIWWKNDK